MTHLDARAAQRRDVEPAGKPGADAVDQQADANAVLGLGAQRRGDLVAERVAGEDEGADVERARRARDDVEHRAACLGTIGVDAERVVRRGRGQAHRAAEATRPERGRLVVAERGRRDRRQRQRGDVAHAQLAAAEHQVERHRDVRQERERDHPGDRRRRIAPLRQGAGDADVDDETERDDDAVQRQQVALEDDV